MAENYVGKILGKITSKELKEIKDAALEKSAIQGALKELFKKSVELERDLQNHKNAWWVRTRQKYNLPTDKDLRMGDIFGRKKAISVSLETGELYISLES